MRKTKELSPTKSRTPPLTFIRQVRQEISRVVWPTRKEVMMTSVLVFIMVFAFATFFLGVDYVLSSIVRGVLGWRTL